MTNLRIGLGQLNSRDNIEENFAAIEQQVKVCADQGAQLVVFPEFSTYLSQRGASQHAQTLEGEIVTTFRELARRYKIHIHNGSFIEKQEGRDKLFNTSVLIGPDGDILSVYRKIHLFDVALEGQSGFRESNKYERGGEIVTAKTSIGDFGMTICYDVRFPALYRQLAIDGAKLIFVPASFMVATGKDHWEALLRARAIENQVFIVAPGQFGTWPDNKVSYGNSMVVDPWGTVIARAPEKVGAVIVDIDWAYLDKVRQSLPSLENRVDLSGLKRTASDK